METWEKQLINIGWCDGWGGPLLTEGVGYLRDLLNYRHPGLRREDPRVRAAGRAPLCLDPLDPQDPGDPLSNSGRLSERVKHKVFGTFSRKMGSTSGLASPKWFLAITCTIWLRLKFWRRGFARFFGAHLFVFWCPGSNLGPRIPNLEPQI